MNLYEIEGQSSQRPFWERAQTSLAIASLTAATVATLFAVGGFLSYYKVLPNAVSWMNRGAYGNWGMVLTSGTFWILGLAFIQTKKNAPVNDLRLDPEVTLPIFEGYLFVAEPMRSGALGNRPEDLFPLFSQTADVMRTDGKEWKHNPDEILVPCFMTHVGMTTFENLYLPLSLFREENDRVKADGDRIQFIYRGKHLNLEIAQKKYTGGSFFEDIVPEIEFAFKSKCGKPIVYNEENKAIRDRTSYSCPLETGKLTKKQIDHIKYRQFMAEMGNSDDQLEMIKFTQTIEGLELDLPESKVRHFFLGETMFALLDTTRPKKRLFVWNFDDGYDRFSIQKILRAQTYEEGVLKFSIPPLPA